MAWVMGGTQWGVALTVPRLGGNRDLDAPLGRPAGPITLTEHPCAA